jgi:hypothetical protein
MGSSKFTILIEDVLADQDAREVAARFAARVRASPSHGRGQSRVDLGVSHCSRRSPVHSGPSARRRSAGWPTPWPRSGRTTSREGSWAPFGALIALGAEVVTRGESSMTKPGPMVRGCYGTLGR